MMKYAKVKYKKPVPKFAMGGTALPSSFTPAPMEGQGMSDASYNTGVAAASKIPVIGGFVGAGAGIASIGTNLVSANAHKVQNDGSYANGQAAVRGNALNTIINPAKALTNVMFNKEASAGQKTAAALTGGVSEVFFARKNKERTEARNMEAAAAQKAEEDKIAAEQKAFEDKQKQIQQDNYNAAYHTANNNSTNGVSMYAKGGIIPAKGGHLKPLASNFVEVKGQTHAQGGVNIPGAEVENKEVIENGQKVYTNRMASPFNPELSISEEAKKLAVIKGKNEKEISPVNYRGLNTKNRTEGIAEMADAKLQQLFAYQQFKNGNNNGSYASVGSVLPVKTYPAIPDVNWSDGASARTIKPSNVTYEEYEARVKEDGGYNGEGTGTIDTESGEKKKFDWAGVANGLTPYVDNIYNAYLLSKMGKPPKPSDKVYTPLKALNMKTTHNVDASLNDIDNQLSKFNTGVDNTTANSTVGRAYKLAALANTVPNKNQLFQNKENIETGLKNIDTENRQKIENANIIGETNVRNENLGLRDQYNRDVHAQDNFKLAQRSLNMSNLVNDRNMQIKDKNAYELDKERMTLDSRKYADSSGLANMIGTKTMDTMVETDEGYYAVYDSLISAGQTAKALELEKTYGKGRKRK